MQARHTPTEEHRSKRKFQPSITSYFEVRDDFEDNDDLRGLDPITRPRHQNTRTATQHQHQHREKLAPDVPGQVQADLLSVGMRVRKSVPEGYKIHKTSGLPSIQTTMSRPTLAVKPPREAVPDEVLHQRELLPFCGLNKIGGFAEQPTTNPHLYAANGTPPPPNYFPLPAETFTQPFSSKASTDSGYSTTSQRPHNPSKRSWQDEDEVRTLDTTFFFGSSARGMGMGVEVDEVPVSPLSETPPQGLNMQPPPRRVALPKSRRTAQRTISDDDIDMDFENAAHMEGRVGAGSGSDFEEADFLSKEVDMGGI
ncbi:ribonucleotide reductase inhibitor-domain-containing protein [Alternaria rosae]|uniref:ribonucleotide reductase inhibitor-domain-containing protein n=1 Tax=Alternaria rosae TaxID=1187941 RepID=UPI001E8D637A|nr:ribonucleotide reductase inhibitor-domain-containing protein [Alternaria rosae]KAH6857344.1 ribonucleotide reductase inhibitor-domain-containing protein [Alternaria rosae]